MVLFGKIGQMDARPIFDLLVASELSALAATSHGHSALLNPALALAGRYIEFNDAICVICLRHDLICGLCFICQNTSLCRDCHFSSVGTQFVGYPDEPRAPSQPAPWMCVMCGVGPGASAHQVARHHLHEFAGTILDNTEIAKAPDGPTAVLRNAKRATN